MRAVDIIFAARAQDQVRSREGRVGYAVRRSRIWHDANMINARQCGRWGIVDGAGRDSFEKGEKVRVNWLSLVSVMPIPMPRPESSTLQESPSPAQQARAVSTRVGVGLDKRDP